MSISWTASGCPNSSSTAARIFTFALLLGKYAAEVRS
jgi:hypothetical protein